MIVQEKYAETKTSIKVKKKVKSTFFYDFLISGSAAAVGKTIIAPVERIKLLLQNQFIIKSSHENYTGIVHCGREIVAKEGFSALWRGNLVNIARFVPNLGFNFAFKDSFKSMFKSYDCKKEFWKFFAANCVSGGLAAAVSLFIIYPIDFARTCMATDNKCQAGKRKYQGSIDCVKKVFEKDGIRGIYKGYVVAATGISLFRAFYFGCYDSLKGSYITEKTRWTIKFTYAQTMTTICSFIFYPFDTVRRRVMLQAGKALNEQNYSSNIDCFRKIKNQEGVKGFYKGFSANVIRIIGAASMLVLFDAIQDFFNLEKRSLGGL